MLLEPQTDQPKKCDGFLIEEMDGELVLLHPARNVIIYANATAALVWQMCDGNNTVGQIIEILSSAYPNARAEIAQDVPQTIQKLRAQGALDGG
jgi:coenzyme PQQ biosynthesis protein PqqD